MSKTPIKILVLGIGGYGHYYYEALKGLQKNKKAELAAIVDPCPESAPAWQDIASLKIPTFRSLDEFFKSGISVQLAAVSSPISFHADQSCALLNAGINVLCEKPIAATMAEALRMKGAEERSGQFLEIGYQWSFSEAIQDLKADILHGIYGKAKSLRTRVAWPRNSAYYTRNNWAGKIYNSQGNPVFDSPVNNATAHYLHNMLFTIGPAMHLSATPKAITAECYRVNAIENYDTACCRIQTEEGPEILFYTTHACQKNDGPAFSYLFEEAEIRYVNGGDIVAYKNDGSIHNYGNPEANPMLKLSICIDKCGHEQAQPTYCGVDASIMHTRCVEALQDMPVTAIPETYFEIKQLDPKVTLHYIPDMEQHMRSAYDAAKLFSEMDFPWVQCAEKLAHR